MDTTLSCRLTTPELQQRKQTVIAALKSRVLETIDIEEGIKLKFNGDDETLDLLSDFIKSERLCCNFFTFTLTVRDVNNLAWLELSGPKGTRHFITSELGF